MKHFQLKLIYLYIVKIKQKLLVLINHIKSVYPIIFIVEVLI